MTSIPDSPKHQFLFFFDNKLVAGEPGGNALVAEFYGLLGPMLGLDGKSTGKAEMTFAPESFAAPDMTAAISRGIYNADSSLAATYGAEH